LRKGFLLILLYLVVILVPIIAATVNIRHMGNSTIYEMGKCCALAGIMIIAMQVILVSRIKWIEKQYGFDIMTRFHKGMAVFGVTLLIMHPLLMAADGPGWSLIFSNILPWYVVAGKVALLLVAVNVVLSVLRVRLKIKFETWRLTHDVLGFVLIPTVFIHSGFAGSDIRSSVFSRILWTVIPSAALLILIYHRLIRPLNSSRRPFVVEEVKTETGDVSTLRLRRRDGGNVPEFKPGQFMFITLRRAAGLPVEEHHFSIASSPYEKTYFEVTIKKLGDFTATIPLTKAGDTADIQAPFGRFSFLFAEKGVKEFVFITAGIGITPVMSMIRYMRDIHAKKRVLLIYGNRTEEDIVFNNELSGIEENRQLDIKVAHVLSSPGPYWTGETGHIDREKITRLCGDISDSKAFYVSGPVAMVSGAVKELKRSGVSDNMMDTEVFSFVD
jgi:predicted ferric reductase